MTAAISAARLRLAPWGRALAPGPNLRRRLMILTCAALVLVATYMLWLRDSSLVAVKQVSVTGLSGQTAEDARAALERAAKGSTTLHVDREGIERAAEAFPAIRSVVITPDFPNALTIQVREHRAVAVLVLGARKIAVAGDGSILPGLAGKVPLPAIEIEGALPARQVGPGPALDAVRVAGGAPAVITDRLEKVERESRRGVVVHVKDGPELVFGDASRVAAKWAAAIRVLADREAAGAEYVDVRIPERPAAGGLPVETVEPVAPAGSEQPPPAAQGVAPVAPQTAAPQAPTVPEIPSAQPQPAPGAAPVAPPAQAEGGAAPNTQP